MMEVESPPRDLVPQTKEGDADPATGHLGAVGKLDTAGDMVNGEHCCKHPLYKLTSIILDSLSGQVA